MRGRSLTCKVTYRQPDGQAIVRYRTVRPELSLYVDGHTDSESTDGYNRDRSVERAASVVKVLIGVALQTIQELIMGLESDVAKVLRAEPVGRINFKVVNIAVNGLQMESVAKAIDNGDIGVKIGNTGSLLGAAYSSWKTRRWGPDEKKLTGEITLGSTKAFNDVVGKAGIFHESVHAMMDVKNIKVSMHDDEVVAYLADALYLKASRHTSLSGKPQDIAIYKAAFAIIDTHKMLIKGGVMLKASDCDALRNAIKANSAYH